MKDQKTTRRAAGFIPAGLIPAGINPAARLLVGTLIFGSIGCQPAMPYNTPEPQTASPKTTVETPRTVEHDLVWMNPRPNELQPDIPIVFVHETNGPQWAKLTKLWNPPATDKGKATTKPVVQVKVPAGLDDPRSAIPSFNPPTLHKWELGRRLFYDKKWLTDAGGESCASCHDPQTGFADNTRDHYGFNTPTLVNCVYNSRQFWNGRAAPSKKSFSIRSTTKPPRPRGRRSVTSGAASSVGCGRSLNTNTSFLASSERRRRKTPSARRWRRTCARCWPADSVYDRALAAQAADHSPKLKVEHYEKALDAAALADLKIAAKDKAEAAKKIYQGYRLFYDLDEHKTGCTTCHGGREFTDGRFHNLGVGFKAFDPGEEPGRFASLPVGEKDGRMIGAYKTPTLRGLSRTGPYFHDGSAATLEDAVQFHLDGGRQNEYLDLDLQKRDLSKPERDALILFLRALNGKDVDLPPVRNFGQPRREAERVTSPARRG